MDVNSQLAHVKAQRDYLARQVVAYDVKLRQVAADFTQQLERVTKERDAALADKAELERKLAAMQRTPTSRAPDAVPGLLSFLPPAGGFPERSVSGPPGVSSGGAGDWKSPGLTGGASVGGSPAMMGLPGPSVVHGGPPGFRAPGTEAWGWKGGASSAEAADLGGGLGTPLGGGLGEPLRESTSAGWGTAGPDGDGAMLGLNGGGGARERARTGSMSSSGLPGTPSVVGVIGAGGAAPLDLGEPAHAAAAPADSGPAAGEGAGAMASGSTSPSPEGTGAPDGDGGGGDDDDVGSAAAVNPAVDGVAAAAAVAEAAKEDGAVMDGAAAAAEGAARGAPGGAAKAAKAAKAAATGKAGKGDAAPELQPASPPAARPPVKSFKDAITSRPKVAPPRPQPKTTITVPRRVTVVRTGGSSTGAGAVPGTGSGGQTVGLKCRNCGQFGHIMRYCPIIQCYRCKTNGHMSGMCPMK